MDNPHDIVTFIYGVIGFVIGWLWGRHRSNAASFVASVTLGAAGFAVGKGLEWVMIATDGWISKFGQNYKLLGTSAGWVASVLWFVVIIAIPAFAIAAFRQADRRAMAGMEPPRRPGAYR